MRFNFDMKRGWNIFANAQFFSKEFDIHCDRNFGIFAWYISYV